MKKHLFVLLLCSVLISGCSEKTTVNTPSETESVSAETNESENNIVESEEEKVSEEDVAVQKEEKVTDAEKIESGQEKADMDAKEPIFTEFEELRFFEDYRSPSYYVLRLSKDGTFEGEIKDFAFDSGYDNTYNRFSGSFEIIEKIEDGIYRLYMKELYLLYEPGSTIDVPGENGNWVADSLTSLVRGHAFYLCLKGTDTRYLPGELEDTYFYDDLTADAVLQSDFLVNYNIIYGYDMHSEYYETVPEDYVINDFPKFTDTVTGINRKRLTPLIFTIDKADFAILDYKQIKSEDEIEYIEHHSKNYWNEPYYTSYLELSNLGIKDVNVDKISIDLLEFVPLEEVDFLCYFAGDGTPEPRVKGVFAEIDPFKGGETPVTQANLEYEFEGALPEIIPTYEAYQGDFLVQEETILYLVGLDFKRLGYYKYCFLIDYTQDHEAKRITTEPRELLETDLSDMEFFDLSEECNEWMSTLHY